MKNLRSVKTETNGTDYESLAIKARQERQQKCSEAIQEILKTHDCALYIALKIGDAEARLNEVINFPGLIKVEAKPK